jgi:hypothetical protein
MSKRSYPFAALVPAVLAAAVVAGSASGGRFVVNDHTSGPQTSGPFVSNWCGEVPGTLVTTFVAQYKEDASGNFLANERFTGVFTATETGKSLLISGAGVGNTTITDNGDGTTTFTTSGAGLAVQFRIPNGPVLKDATGSPIIGAGEATTSETVDNATGETISFTGVFHGPHPLHDGVDICGPSVAYLLDP